MFKPTKEPQNLGRNLLWLTRSRQQSGFTLIESLIALLVSAALLTGLAPMVALSVAARVQSRRIDLATQAARTYIDGLRAGVIPPPSDNSAIFSQTNLGVGAPASKPTGTGTCFNPKDPNDTTCTSSDSFVIQAIRDGYAFPVVNANDPRTAGYCVAVRVYRADAFDGMSPNQTEPAKSIFTAGTGQKNYPLVVMKTEIINQTSFDKYQNRFKKDSSKPSDPTNSKPTPCNPPP